MSTVALSAGTAVSLAATPDPGRTFLGWAGDCTGSGGCTVTMTQDRNVSAMFSQPVASTDGGTADGGAMWQVSSINWGIRLTAKPRSR